MELPRMAWSVVIGGISIISHVCCVCLDPGGVANGQRTIEGVEEGDTVVYSCKEGYQLSVGGVEYLLACGADGLWNGTNPYCQKIACPIPRDIDYAVRTGDGNFYNDDVTYQCEYGYRLLDNSRDVTITCLSTGDWDRHLDEILCLRVQCPPLVQVPNGDRPLGTFYFGDTVPYPCQTGFQLLQGSAQFTCLESGQWEGTYPTCELADCGDPGEPVNSRREHLTGTRYGSIVTYRCEPGYHAWPGTQALTRTCTDTGEWSEPALECRGAWCGPPTPAVLNSTHTPTTWRYPDTVTFTCDPGFKPIFSGDSNDEVTCLVTGEWDFAVISCARIYCSDVGETENVEISTQSFRYTDVKEYQCLGGFIPYEGNVTRTCQADGTFSGEGPKCKRVGCADPGEFDFSSRIVQGFLFNDLLSYSCWYGYIVGDNAGMVDQTSICTTNGTWSPTPERCKPAFCGQPDGQGLVQEGESFFYGDTVLFRCKPGYISLEENMERFCQANGLWNGEPPRCRRLQCGDPGTVRNSHRAGTVFTFEAIVSYQCDPGYAIVSGNKQLMCSADGTWNGTLPTCERIICQEPEPVPNADIVKYGNRYGSRMEYNCHDGFTLQRGSGDRRRVCEAQGSWSGRPPVCDRISCGDPGHVNFTFRTGNSFYYGDQVNYSCVIGHVNKFQVTWTLKTCTDAGVWTDEEITCAPIKCGNPGVTDTRLQLMRATGFFYGDTVQYDCVHEYIILNQPKSLFCQFNGQWSAEVPDCVPVPHQDTDNPVATDEEPEVVEADGAETYGMICIILMSTEFGIIVLLDCMTLSKDLRYLAGNLRACCRRLSPKVAPKKQDKEMTDEDLADLFLNDPWAYRAQSPTGRSYDELGTSSSSLQDSQLSGPVTNDEYTRPSTAARRLQFLALIAGNQPPKGGKKKKVLIAS